MERTNLPKRSRREVLIGIAGVAGFGAVAAILARYVRPAAERHAKTVDLGTIEEVFGATHHRVLTLAGEPVILVRDEGSDLRAYSMRCTHAGCPLEFRGNGIRCSCHGGAFDLHGKPVAGPPKRPLASIPVMVSQQGHVLVHISPPGERT